MCGVRAYVQQYAINLLFQFNGCPIGGSLVFIGRAEDECLNRKIKSTRAPTRARARTRTHQTIVPCHCVHSCSCVWLHTPHHLLSCANGDARTPRYCIPLHHLPLTLSHSVPTQNSQRGPIALVVFGRYGQSHLLTELNCSPMYELEKPLFFTNYVAPLPYRIK